MIWKKFERKEEQTTIFQKIHENYIPGEFMKEEGILKFYEPTEVIIPFNDSKKISEKKKSKRSKGRRPKNFISIITPCERIHSRLNADNIKRKIKTHFHCFIISLLNLTIKKEYDGVQKFKFKKMDSQITQNITISYNKELLSTPIKQILKNVSHKYHDRYKNEKILSKIPESKTEINKLLNCTYQEMYENYYLKSRNDMFKNEKENNSFEYHLIKIQNKFGWEYMEKYKDNAINFIYFFLYGKKRKQKLLSENDVNVEEKK